jgi:oligoribonuclease NrnB/cAMP/cGMP phosphodiesterase (DHH superfamily)
MIFNDEVVCIYHSNCLDGIAAAWVVWDHYRKKGEEITLTPGVYNKPLPEGLQGKTVIIVDFSYDYETTEWLLENTDLVLLDHHDTAVRRLQNLTLNTLLKVTTGKSKGSKDHPNEFISRALENNFKGIVLDSEYSGAMLAWRYFNPGQRAPDEIVFVQDRDLWQFKYDNTKRWTEMAFSYPLTVETFDKFVNHDQKSDLLVEGHALMRKQAMNVERISESSRIIDIDGIQGAVVNTNYMYASDIGDFFKNGFVFVATYSDSKDCRIFSLRSRKDGGANVALLAERFGGGGHQNAAGFKLKFTDKRFAKSHERIRSEGFYWRAFKGFLSTLFTFM